MESKSQASAPSTSSSDPTPLPERLIDRIEGDGPVLIAVGGLHGNEPSGIVALERVCRALREQGLTLEGTLIALRGNRPALAKGQRMIERDLNRVWSPLILEHLLRRDPAEDDTTDQEMRALWWEINAAKESGRPLFLLDLHSTSGLGPPFCVVLGNQPSQRLAASIGLPCVHGLNESIRGTLAEWFSHGYGASMVAEGGKCGEESTIRHLEAVIYSAMGTSGLLGEEHDRVRTARQLLQQATEEIPHHVRVFYREPASGVDFVMGEAQGRRFQNFDSVRQGDHLARNRDGAVFAQRDGYLIMPLYQAEGGDGFFLAEACEGPPTNP